VRFQTVARWRDPDQRGNLMRGLVLEANTEEHIERARQQMAANRQNPQFNAALLCGQRRLTPDQVLAIRADPRSSRIVGAAYGVSRTVITMIRTRRYYAEV